MQLNNDKKIHQNVMINHVMIMIDVDVVKMEDSAARDYVFHNNSYSCEL